MNAYVLIRLLDNDSEIRGVYLQRQIAALHAIKYYVDRNEAYQLMENGDCTTVIGSDYGWEIRRFEIQHN